MTKTATLGVANYARPRPSMRGVNIKPPTLEGRFLEQTAELLEEAADKFVARQVLVSKLRGHADECRRRALGVEGGVTND